MNSTFDSSPSNPEPEHSRWHRLRTGSRLLVGVFSTIGFGAVALLLSMGVLLGLGAMVPTVSRIPIEIRVACAGLIILALFFIVRMMGERGRALMALRKFKGALGTVGPGESGEYQSGLTPERMRDLRQRFSHVHGEPAKWWLRLEEALICYTRSDGKQGWFLTRSCEEVLPEEELLSPFYHYSFHQAVPSVLTALGLLATFTAILSALSQLVYNPGLQGSPVSGIDKLINGLAGKFLSSIIALVLSVIFTFIEKKVCERRLHAEYASLIYVTRRRLPYLSPLQVLIDIRQAVTPPPVAAMERWEAPPEPEPEPEPIPEPQPEPVIEPTPEPEPEPAPAPAPEVQDGDVAQ